MRLVVDANVVVAALLRAGATRELVLHAPLELFAPNWLTQEASRFIPEVARRSRLGEPVIRALLERILARVTLVADEALSGHAAEAMRRVRKSGIKDAAYVACALAVDCTLWTADGDLRAECGVPTVTTNELLARFLPS